MGREDDDSLNEIIMAVEMRERGTVGCAYYVAREEKLYLIEDIKMGNLDIIDTLKLHSQPTVVLISTRSDEKLETHLNKEARGIDRDDDASMLPFLRRLTLLIRMNQDDIFGTYILDSRPSAEFQYESAKNRLVNLELRSGDNPKIAFITPGENIAGDGHGEGGTNKQAKLLRLGGCIDLDSRLTV